MQNPAMNEMSDRELLEEIATTLRNFNDALEKMSHSPMLSAMGVKLGK